MRPAITRRIPPRIARKTPEFTPGEPTPLPKMMHDPDYREDDQHPFTAGEVRRNYRETE